MKRGAQFWFAVGLGVAGVAMVTTLVVLNVRNRRRRDELDPRTQQVKELIDEAEQLLLLGRRGLQSSRRARA